MTRRKSMVWTVAVWSGLVFLGCGSTFLVFEEGQRTVVVKRDRGVCVSPPPTRSSDACRQHGEDEFQKCVAALSDGGAITASTCPYKPDAGPPASSTTP